eukprot:TRINITY_DN1544_c0_g2_i1.p1 TRINITY_DN1544_c0_g2~~TRINITY_DN1544_c0_g2_i1.p1  ORF type:complete len:349 (-),score=94.36 TRINITY_DN1544_c0_g2_i1:403-1449(-)
MDADRQALFRATARRRQKRLDDPLIRYNDKDQPVCKVCNLALRSESEWSVHLVSKKHKQAVENFKAMASKLGAAKSKKVTHDADKNDAVQPSSSLATTRSSTALPSDFFDKPEAKRQCSGPITSVPVDDRNSSTTSLNTQTASALHESNLIESKGVTFSRPKNIVNNGDASLEKTSLEKNVQETTSRMISDDTATREAMEHALSSKLHDSANTQKANDNHVKGTLPEGFFDNKEADLRARGLKPVKPDIKDELREFQKVIQEDLQEVDDRLDEEENDAAEEREVKDLLEQRAYVERVELLKNKQREISMAKASAKVKSLSFMNDESSDDSSDEDIDEEMLIDWRAKNL